MTGTLSAGVSEHAGSESATWRMKMDRQYRNKRRNADYFGNRPTKTYIRTRTCPKALMVQNDDLEVPEKVSSGNMRPSPCHGANNWPKTPSKGRFRVRARAVSAAWFCLKPRGGSHTFKIKFSFVFHLLVAAKSFGRQGEGRGWCWERGRRIRRRRDYALYG
jgi:hypothetical protein